MIWREVWVCKGLSTKTHSETTTTCYLEHPSKDGFAVIFGNSAVKSTRAASASDGKDPTSHRHISLSDKEWGLLVLDVVVLTAKHNPPTHKLQLDIGTCWDFKKHFSCVSCLDKGLYQGTFHNVNEGEVLWEFSLGGWGVRPKRYSDCPRSYGLFVVKWEPCTSSSNSQSINYVYLLFYHFGSLLLEIHHMPFWLLERSRLPPSNEEVDKPTSKTSFFPPKELLEGHPDSRQRGCLSTWASVPSTTLELDFLLHTLSLPPTLSQ